MPKPKPAKDRPTLTADQESLIYRVAGKRVAATVSPRIYQAPPKLPSDFGSVPILGAFVSLKRSGQLRSCCGYMADAIPLGEAVDFAAIRAAKDDPRFPPISPNEIDHLDMEVWLLWNMQEMTATGRDRIDALEIGKHGLVVEQGHARGLLLPAVATEHGFDNEEFLRQTCRKAGLPLDAWLDPKTKVFTFEGHVLQGKLASTLETDGDAASNPEANEASFETPGPSDADVVRLAQFCHSNLVANLTGATPNPYAASSYDGSINGLLLSVSAPGLENPIEIGRLAIKPPIPLQTTLFPLTQTAAAALRGANLRSLDPGQLEVGLTVLWDPMMHGPTDSPDIAGVNPALRAILVLGPSGWSWAYDPEVTAEALLECALANAQLPKGTNGQVISFSVASTEDRVISSNVPKPEAPRSPAVAGMFYPRTTAEIDRMLDELSAEIEKSTPEPWPGVMIPHAGWIYSGRIAIETLSRVKIPKTALILAPKHNPGGAAWAISPSPAWKLPGGQEIPSDPELIEKLLASIEGLEADTGAHRAEHSIEVQLPILARLAPETRVVGIAMHGGGWDDYARFATQLAEVLQTLDEPPLLIASSDMNHFADEETTRRVDRLALDAIESLDPKRLYETVRENQISMCGVVPTAILMETLRHLGKLKRTELVDYETSAKASGDTSRVVGYAGVLFG
ncbi:MAG: AmmeMemoRadiSam system protein B [Planctomycetia bacterium]